MPCSHMHVTYAGLNITVQKGGGGGGGGGSNRLPALVTKQQAVEFPQVQTSTLNYSIATSLYTPIPLITP